MDVLEEDNGLDLTLANVQKYIKEHIWNIKDKNYLLEATQYKLEANEDIWDSGGFDIYGTTKYSCLLTLFDNGIINIEDFSSE